MSPGRAEPESKFCLNQQQGKHSGKNKRSYGSSSTISNVYPWYSQESPDDPKIAKTFNIVEVRIPAHNTAVRYTLLTCRQVYRWDMRKYTPGTCIWASEHGAQPSAEGRVLMSKL